MLLVQMTIGGSVKYFSNDFLDIQHFYDPYVASLAQLRFETREVYGGFAEPTFGQIDLLPTAFTGNWPPPVSCAIKILIAVTGETDAETMFEGTAHLATIGRDSVVYDLFGPSITTTVIDGVYSGTLNAVFTAACSTLSLTLNTTYARATSPAVSYTADGEKLLIDNLSDIAAFFCHRFYIQGSTLYLVDCLLDNGSVLVLTEFDIFPSNYTQPKPYKQFQAKYSPAISKYRFVFSDVSNAGDLIVSLTNIEMRTVQDGVDETTNVGGTASAKDYFNASYVPSYAVDSDLTTRWASLTNVSTLPWWQFVFNSAVKIIEYSFMLHDSASTQSPTAWKVQGYDDDNAAFRTIKDEVSDPDWTAGEVRKFSLPIPEWEVTVAGTHAYGDDVAISPVCHTALANIQTALANIKTVMERTRIEMVKPLSGVPKIGQKITLTDESLFQSTSVWARVSAVVWDFDQEQCVVEGEGALT